MSTDKLFEPARIGALTIKNRFVRSATSETMSRDDGVITEDYARLYLDIARGGAGLIFTGHIYVHPRGRYVGRQAGAHDDAVIEPYKRFTERIHDAGGTIFGELGHAGSQSRDPSVTPLAPSPVENFISARRPGSGRRGRHRGGDRGVRPGRAAPARGRLRRRPRPCRARLPDQRVQLAPRQPPR